MIELCKISFRLQDHGQITHGGMALAPQPASEAQMQIVLRIEANIVSALTTEFGGQFRIMTGEVLVGSILYRDGILTVKKPVLAALICAYAFLANYPSVRDGVILLSQDITDLITHTLSVLGAAEVEVEDFDADDIARAALIAAPPRLRRYFREQLGSGPTIILKP